MKGTFDHIYDIIRELKVLGKPLKIKAAKLSLGMYRNDKETLWYNQILSSDKDWKTKVGLEVRLSIKPLAFDRMHNLLRCNDPDAKIGDALNANINDRFYIIDKTSFFFDRDKVEAGEITERDMAKIVFDDALAKLDAFWAEVREHGDIYQFFIDNMEEDPMIAGMACLCQGRYEEALTCFRYAEEHDKIWYQAIGHYRRYYHLIAIDYCRIKLAGKEWKDEYVVDGIDGQPLPIDAIQMEVIRRDNARKKD